jgi:hypothetical protein
MYEKVLDRIDTVLDDADGGKFDAEDVEEVLSLCSEIMIDSSSSPIVSKRQEDTIAKLGRHQLAKSKPGDEKTAKSKNLTTRFARNLAKFEKSTSKVSDTTEVETDGAFLTTANLLDDEVVDMYVSEFIKEGDATPQVTMQFAKSGRLEGGDVKETQALEVMRVTDARGSEAVLSFSKPNDLKTRKCAYLIPGTKKWSTKGVKTDNSVIGKIRCKTSHTSVFKAVTDEEYDGPVPLPTVFEANLWSIGEPSDDNGTKVENWISLMIFAGVTLVVFPALFFKLRKKDIFDRESVHAEQI